MTQAVGHKLPVLGARHLEFRCNGCGGCCRALRVSVTHHDLRRLLEGRTGQAVASERAALGRRRAAELVDWLAADTVDMTGEPGSFVELAAGRRLMVLGQRGGACALLDPQQRCSVYPSRPQDCRIFPFDLARDAAGSVVAISRIELEGCDDERGPPAPLTEVAELDRRRWEELGEYQALVARWNRLARHRRRFRQRVGDAAAYLAWLGFDAQAGNSGGAPRAR